MNRNSSKSSINKKYSDNYFQDPNKLLLNKIQSTLQDASNYLSFQQFYSFYINIVISLIHRCETESIDLTNFDLLKKIVRKYNPNLQITARLILLQVKVQILSSADENLGLLNKAKHMIIGSQYEYLLAKIFILEAKVYEKLNQKSFEIKYLMKAIDFAENFVLQYLNDKQHIRKQIAQIIVMAYFELYKLKKEENHREAEQYLRRASRATEKNYGEQSEVSKILALILNQYKNIGRGLEKMQGFSSLRSSLKATTQIFNIETKKGARVQSIYLWQDEKIIVHMIQSKYFEEKMVSWAEFNIKLDMFKINLLRSSDWVKILQNEIIILEDEVLKIIGLKQENPVTTRVEIKNISREGIMRKDISDSNSSDHPSFIQNSNFDFIRKLGRTQSARKQLN